MQLRRKSDIFQETEGTYNKLKNEDDKANQSHAEELNIKNMLIKYGCVPDQFLNKATEELYINNIGTDLTLNERLKQEQQVTEYFENLPARVRKKFNDSPKEFFQGLALNKLDKYKEYGILNDNQIERLNKVNNAKNTKIEELQNQITLLKGQLNEIQINNEKIDSIQ